MMMSALAAWIALTPPPRVHELPAIEVNAERVTAEVLLPFTSASLAREEIERRPGADLSDLLETVAGVRVAARGLAASSVSIRGSTTDQVVVLVDGRRIHSAQGGGADVASLTLDGAESIDVIRGGASAVWGGDALGGAVNVHARPARPGFRTRVAAGSFGERRVEGDAGFLLGQAWTLRGAAQMQTTDGDFPFAPSDGHAERRIVNGDLERVASELRADGVVRGAGMNGEIAFFDQERGVPGSAEFPTPSARLNERRILAGAVVRTLGTGWRKEADVSWLSQTHRYLEPSAAFGPLDDKHENTRGRMQLSLGRGSGARAMEAAFGLVSDRLESSTDGTRRRDGADFRILASRDVRARGRTFEFLGAARVDAIRGWKPVTSPRAGINWHLTPGFRVSGTAGTAFRIPSFDELFWAPRGSAAGNPDLRMERGRDVDFGFALDGFSRGASLTATAFARDVRDLIQWLPGAEGVWRPHNLGRARLFGVEADARATWRLANEARLRLTASGTWLRSEDRSGEPNVNGKDLVYRPEWTGAFSLLIAEPVTGEFEATLRATDDVFVTRANTKQLAGAALLDLRWRRAVAAGLRVDVLLANATGESVRDFRDYPLPGRSLSAGLTWERGRS